jgi:hypothetical protein
MVHAPMSTANSAITNQTITFKYLGLAEPLLLPFGVSFAIRDDLSGAGFRVCPHCRLIQIKKASVKRSPSAIEIHTSLLRCEAFFDSSGISTTVLPFWPLAETTELDRWPYDVSLTKNYNDSRIVEL